MLEFLAWDNLPRPFIQGFLMLEIQLTRRCGADWFLRRRPMCICRGSLQKSFTSSSMAEMSATALGGSIYLSESEYLPLACHVRELLCIAEHCRAGQ
jgi:hypothetical protein